MKSCMLHVTQPADRQVAFNLTLVHLDRYCAGVRATGELDLAANGTLRSLLIGSLQTQHRFVCFDMSAVTFIDCSSLGVLVTAHHRFLAEGGALVLTGVRAWLARLLDLTQLDGTLFSTATAVDTLERSL